MLPLQACAYVLVAIVWNVAAEDPAAHAAIPAGRISFNDWQCGATAAERILAYDSARSVCGDYMRECELVSILMRTPPPLWRQDLRRPAAKTV